MLKRSKPESTQRQNIPMRGDTLLIVLGSGSVGSLFGGLIASSGYDVVLVGRPGKHIQQIKTQQLTIRGLKNCRLSLPAYDSVVNISSLIEKAAFILITTKAHQTAEAIKNLKGLVPKKVPLILLQNGMGVEELLANEFPGNLILRAVTSIGVCRPEPGVVEYTGLGETFLGYYSEAERVIAERLKKLIFTAGLEVKLDSNIKGRVFTKTIVNCALNPLTALYQVKNKEILQQKPLREKAALLAQEAWNVAKAMHITLTVEDPIAYTFEVIRKTGENINSMLTDILGKRLTEIDFLNGKIVSLGQKLGVDVSNNLEIYNKIKTLERSFQQR